MVQFTETKRAEMLIFTLQIHRDNLLERTSTRGPPWTEIKASQKGSLQCVLTEAKIRLKITTQNNVQIITLMSKTLQWRRIWMFLTRPEGLLKKKMCSQALIAALSKRETVMKISFLSKINLNLQWTVLIATHQSEGFKMSRLNRLIREEA